MSFEDVVLGNGPMSFSHNVGLQQQQANNLANANHANYVANQNYVRDFGQQAINNTFASGGGFGAQTAHYAGLGAAYGRATGGFNAQPGDYGTKTNPFGPGGNLAPRGVPAGNVWRGPDLPNLSPARNPFINYPSHPDMSSAARSPFSGMFFGGNQASLAHLLRGAASPQAPDLRLGFGKSDRLPLFQGGGGGTVPFRGAGRDFGDTFGQMPRSLEQQLQDTLGIIDRARGLQSPPYLSGRGITDFGGMSRSPVYSGGGIGSDIHFGGQNIGGFPAGRVTRGPNLAPAGRGDPYFFASNPAGFNPTTAGMGGIGSDRRYGGQNMFTRSPQFDTAIDAVTPDARGRFGGFGSSPFQMPSYIDRRSSLGGPIRAGGGDRFGDFNPFSLDPNAMRAPATSFTRSPTPFNIQSATRSGVGGIGSDMRYGNQNELYAQPWHGLIPGNRGLNTPEIIKQVNYAAGANRQSPAALANLINTESVWNSLRRSPSGGHFGATQIQPSSFREAGGTLGGMTLQQFKRAPLEQQISAYPDYLAFYGRQPNTGAALARSDIRHHPVPLQSAIMMGAQFSPYGGLPRTIDWPGAFARGDMSMGITPAPQAPFLSFPQGTPPTLSSMNRYFTGATPR